MMTVMQSGDCVEKHFNSRVLARQVLPQTPMDPSGIQLPGREHVLLTSQHPARLDVISAKQVKPLEQNKGA